MYINEGDCCLNEGCNGVLEYLEVENCYCHIVAPCNICVNNPLACSECGEEIEP